MNHSHPTRTIWVLLSGLLAFAAPSVTAQRAVIEGQLLSTQDNHPVEFALVFMDEVRRSSMSDVQGRFRFENIPAGHHTFHATRIGFQPLTQVLDVESGDTLRLVLHMVPDIIEVDEVVVESNRVIGESEGVAHRMEGDRLRQHLGTTIAETLDEEPGIAMRSMGPAPARPVMRGLGGERLLVLENGGQMGDLSQTSSDHALMVDPLTADRLEIIRGPEALLHGPNTMAGAINVVRETILASVPERVQASLAFQGQSVSSGLASGGSIALPLGRKWAFRTNGSTRTASDVHTPEGRLGNTQLHTTTASAGLSRVMRTGFVGVSGSWYDTGYGIPGGFIGAHPNGVSVEADRWYVELRGEWLAPLPWIRRLETVGSWSRYFHQEFESSGALGIEYGLLTGNARAVAHMGHLGPFEHGAFGISAQFRDYAAGGFSFTPATVERSMAVFGYQDFHVGATTIMMGLRGDHRRVLPAESGPSDIGDIRERTFSGLSASLSVRRPILRDTEMEILVMRGLRLPGIEELFSAGPHLAAYSFEVGNPSLVTERGTGFELSVRHEGRTVRGSAAVFLNHFDGFIFPLNTGELDYRIYVPIYQYSGTDAEMVGAEGRISWSPKPTWTFSQTLSWVRGTLTELDSPIPWTPPLRSSSSVQWKKRAWTASTTIRAMHGQGRLGPFEEGTDGYIVPDAAVEYHLIARAMMHTFTLALDNITDTTYRDHLSRVKSIMPEPGRNLRLLYRVWF
ncbi:MAG: TonB-dependent receptor [Bacteroidetes bacterium]|nr:TonB-dependent receptor [Bacteroidota bacterium]